MSLNPIQFGKHVVDQFGRYLRTTFPIADERLAAPVADERAPTFEVLRCGASFARRESLEQYPEVDTACFAARRVCHPLWVMLYSPTSNVSQHTSECQSLVPNRVAAPDRRNGQW